MPSLDVFNSNAFGMVSLTEAIDMLPYDPSFLGDMRLFQPRPVRTTQIMIEERHGQLSLIQTSARGTMNDVKSRPIRQARNFTAPHVPYFQTILADDIQNVRQFGSETELESVGMVVNDSLSNMRFDHETTFEWHRIGAVKGIVLDADGTELVNYFDGFQVTPPTPIAVTFGTTIIKNVATTVTRQISTTLGATRFRKILALCGDDFFDGLTNATDVLAAFDRWNDGAFFRTTQIGPEYNADMNGFDFANITWVNYRGKIGSQDFIDTDMCHLVPLGVNGLFQQIMAPADFMETVNTRGRALYAKQQRMDFDKGIELHTQSNSLFICTRPGVLLSLQSV